MEHSLPQSFGSARPPSSRGSNARRSEDRRQVLKEVRDIETLCQTIEEHRVANTKIKSLPLPQKGAK